MKTAEFNLRLNKTHEKDGNGNLKLLFCASVFFAFLCILFFVFSCFALKRQNAELAKIRRENDIRAQAIVDSEKVTEKAIRKAKELNLCIDFLLNAQPVFELLSDLSLNNRDDIAVEYLKISGNRAKISGVAYLDENILEYCETLQNCTSVKSVSTPDIKAEMRNDIMLRAFTIELSLRQLEELLIHRREKDEK